MTAESQKTFANLFWDLESGDIGHFFK